MPRTTDQPPRPNRHLLLLALLPAVTSGMACADEPPRPTRMSYTIDTSWSIDVLIDELRDDDVLWNARDAVDAIMNHPTSPVDRLQHALDDPDHQVRQIACDLLWGLREAYRDQQSDNDMMRVSYVRWRPTPDSPAWRRAANPPITDRLIAVTIEGLRDDQTPYDRMHDRALMYTNAVHGLYRLIPVAVEWRPAIEAALESDDTQQRLLAAIILGMGGVSESVELAAPVLLPHLRDNSIRGDARACVLALFGFGPSVLPSLREAMPGADKQQRELLTLLMLDITDPPASEKERITRSRFNSISNIVHDPAVEPHGTDHWGWLKGLD